MSTGTSAPKDMFSMSDEDFLRMGVPPEPAAEAPREAAPAAAAPAAPAPVDDDPPVPGETPPELEDDAPPVQGKPTPAEAAAAAVAEVLNPLNLPDDQIGQAPPKPAEPAPAPEPVVDPAAPSAGSSEAPAAPAADPATGSETPPDYKALYEQLMAPLKANGKTIDLRSPEELIQLAQMGANYTRKLQDIAPHRKMLAMLENNGLLDEGQLSFLIDLSKKNPEAIKKLVKDSGLDPMDIDVSVDPAYRAGNHRVSDEEVNFRSVLDDLGSNSAGQQTLQTINTSWDQASKDALWKQPEMMTVIHGHRESGVYAQVTAEMDRQKTLGTLRHDMPFLQAYQMVGDQLNAAGRFTAPAPVADPAPAPTPTPPQVVATRVAAPKPTLANGEQARAASPSQASPRKAAETFNPLAMSDADFEKAYSNFQNRL